MYDILLDNDFVLDVLSEPITEKVPRLHAGCWICDGEQWRLIIEASVVKGYIVIDWGKGEYAQINYDKLVTEGYTKYVNVNKYLVPIARLVQGVKEQISEEYE